MVRIAAGAVMLILIVLVAIEFRHDLRFDPFLEPALHADYYGRRAGFGDSRYHQSV